MIWSGRVHTSSRTLQAGIKLPPHDSTCLCRRPGVQAEAQQAESVDVINAWADRVTKGLIKVAVPPGTPFDVVLTNAVYFKVLLSLLSHCCPSCISSGIEASLGGLQGPLYNVTVLGGA